MRGDPEPQASQPAPKPAREPKIKARGIFLDSYVNETTKRYFKVLRSKCGLTEQAALEEMSDDFFSKYGKYRIARRLSEVEG